MTLLIDGQLEIDQERGVIYFHSNQTGTTPLRICSLPKPIPDPRWIITNGAIKQTGKALDITHMYGANWGSDLENHYCERIDPIKIQEREKVSPLSFYEEATLNYLRTINNWVSPNCIGECFKPSRLASSYSAWACPILKRLVKKGYALRNDKGQYKAIVIKRGI